MNATVQSFLFFFFQNVFSNVLFVFQICFLLRFKSVSNHFKSSLFFQNVFSHYCVQFVGSSLQMCFQIIVNDFLIFNSSFPFFQKCFQMIFKSFFFFMSKVFSNTVQSFLFFFQKVLSNHLFSLFLLPFKGVFE